MSASAKIFIRDFCVVVIMAFCAGGIGLLLNHFRANPLPMGYEPKAARVQNAASRLAEGAAVSSPAPDARQIDLAAFRDLVEHRVTGIILDARPVDFYRIGHVPGAMSLSREAFEADYTRQRSHLESDKSQLIVVYCSDSDCDDSQMVAEGLGKLAYTRVFIFKGGWEDWTAAHLPEEKAR